MKLSVALISFNEEENIGRTLSAIKDIADEIIIVDSFSTDDTVKITKEYGATVYIEEWKGHIAQKNSALEKCKGDWILSLDSDEVVDETLKNAIVEALREPGTKNGFTLNRKTFYMGRLLNRAWQPDKKLRLVKREALPRWAGYNPHDVLMVEGDKGALNGHLIHYSYKDFRDHMQKTLTYARLAADSYWQKGKRASFISLFFKPVFTFFKRMLLQGAFLDGIPGLMAAYSSAYYVYMKYAFLWERANTGK